MDTLNITNVLSGLSWLYASPNPLLAGCLTLTSLVKQSNPQIVKLSDDKGASKIESKLVYIVPQIRKTTAINSKSFPSGRVEHCLAG